MEETIHGGKLDTHKEGTENGYKWLPETGAGNF